MVVVCRPIYLVIYAADYYGKLSMHAIYQLFMLE